MGVLSQLEPKNVFEYFEEITKIPHGSKNVEQISDYLVNFARERNLFCIQDELKNVIIVKEASAGYEEEPTLIIQGHMDMVAVHRPDYEIDMKTEGLKAAICGDNIYAEGTSLGGDDGIAVAYALAVLDSDTLKHPRLEVVITVDEEIGMDGARGIDLSMLKGKRMLNIDSEKEGIFLASCAGGARVKCLIPVQKSHMTGAAYEVHIGGLRGGHSGEEIDKERANSNCLFGRILWKLADKINVGVVSASGGLADNAITRETRAVLAAEDKDAGMFMDIINEISAQIKDELMVKDGDYFLEVKEVEKGDILCSAFSDTKRMAGFLFAAPNGVQAMSVDLKGLVETSLNLGILKFDAKEDKGVLEAVFSVRSSVESSKNMIIDKLRAVAEMSGGTIEISGIYPGWKYRACSPLRDKMTGLYERMYGVKPKVEAIHAGLECGLLADKIQGLDCLSIGPDMENIHTTEETLSISSTRRVWEFLVELLALKD